LAIARSLINAQGGEIGAESPPEGGASVWFWLPVNENELAAAARLPES
jgi:signal transduction histidine kinase